MAQVDRDLRGSDEEEPKWTGVRQCHESRPGLEGSGNLIKESWRY